MKSDEIRHEEIKVEQKCLVYINFEKYFGILKILRKNQNFSIKSSIKLIQ